MRQFRILLFCFALTALAGQLPKGIQSGEPILAAGDVAQAGGSASVRTICGLLDDRVPSTDARIGRIEPSGCTAWNIKNGKLLTAGHCFADLVNTSVSFNVPPSLPDGTRQLPAAKDRYVIDPNSIQFTENGVGDDWAVFTVFDNAETGKQPLAVEGGFDLAQSLTPASIRVTGYGADFDEADGALNRTNQTHLGSNVNSSGTVMRYNVDTTAGNSGSPIIDEATGAALGIHTHGGCQTVGANKGTSFLNEDAWAAINSCLPNPPSQALSNGVAVEDLYATQSCTELRFTFDVPNGMTDLKFVTDGPTANADLYIKLGSPPTLSTFDCVSISSSSNEQCSFTNPSAGAYFVLINPTSSFTELSLTASYGVDESFCFPVKRTLICL